MPGGINIHVRLATPAFLSAMSILKYRAFASSGGAVIWYVHHHRIADQLSINAPRTGVLQFFEDHHPSPFAQDKPDQRSLVPNGRLASVGSSVSGERFTAGETRDTR